MVKLITKTVLTLVLIGLSMSAVYAQTGNVGPRGSIYDDPADGIYVSPNGNDATADGSIDKPYKSINTALNAAINNVLPSTTIILRGGLYQERRDVRVRMSNVTIKSAKGEWAVIDLTTYDSGHDEDSGVEFYAEDAITGGVVTNCKLQSVEVKGGFYAVCCGTQWDWPLPPVHGSGVSNIIIEDCILHHSTNDVVKVKPGCDNITIRYNEIHHSGQAYIDYANFTSGERNSEGIDNVNGDNMHVHNNYIHDICSTGIYAKGGAIDAIIENNIVERTYAAGIMVGFDTNIEFFDTTVNPLYYENIGGICRNNLIIDAGWESIGLYSSLDAQVYNNTIVNATTYGTGNYHSPIYFGYATQDGQSGYGHTPNLNPNIHHNIVNEPSAFNARMIEIRYLNEMGGISCLDGNPTMNDNCYYVSGKNAIFRDMRPPEVNNMNLTEWKTHISSDNGSIEVNPALDANYMPTNTQCTDMGLLYPLILNDFTKITEPVEKQNITVYPNPTNGEWRVESGEWKVERVEIFDAMGKMQKEEKRLQKTEWVLDVSDLSAGIYFFKIHTENGVVTRKVVKQ